MRKKKKLYDLYHFDHLDVLWGYSDNKGIVVNKDRHTGKWSRIESINRFIKDMANWFPINMSRLFIWERIAFFSMNAPGAMGYLSGTMWTLMPIYYSYQKKKAK